MAPRHNVWILQLLPSIHPECVMVRSSQWLLCPKFLICRGALCAHWHTQLFPSPTLSQWEGKQLWAVIGLATWWQMTGMGCHSLRHWASVLWQCKRMPSLSIIKTSSYEPSPASWYMNLLHCALYSRHFWNHQCLMNNSSFHHTLSVHGTITVHFKML